MLPKSINNFEIYFNLTQKSNNVKVQTLFRSPLPESFPRCYFQPKKSRHITNQTATIEQDEDNLWTEKENSSRKIAIQNKFKRKLNKYKIDFPVYKFWNKKYKFTTKKTKFISISNILFNSWNWQSENPSEKKFLFGKKGVFLQLQVSQAISATSYKHNNIKKTVK